MGEIDEPLVFGAPGAEEPAGEQLDLFTPDRLEIGEAFEALVRLELERARSVFAGLVARYPDSSRAAAGAATAGFWGGLLDEIDRLDPASGAQRLWRAIVKHRGSPDLASPELAAALLERTLALLEASDTVLVEPDLCAGRVLLELGRPAAAVDALREAMRRSPRRARLCAFLGDALNALGRPLEARAEYARALLLDPDDVLVDALLDREVADLVARRGKLAPAWGWVEGLLPLVEPPAGEGAEGEDTLAVCRLLKAAEEARRLGRHEAMVEARRRLKDRAPELFAAYLARLEIGSLGLG